MESPAQTDEPLLSGPASSHAAPELSGPAPKEPVATAPKPPASAPTPPAPAAPSAPASGDDRMGERLAAELRELNDIVVNLESLAYLKPRVAKSMAEGVDAITLVSFYRLVARTLKDEAAQARSASEQYRKEFEKMRARMSKMEVEFAGAVEAAKASVGGKDTEETLHRLKSLETQLNQANEQREKLLLDFKNLRERAQRDTDFKVFKEKEKFFTSFLPVLDGFERAAMTMNDSSSVSSLLEGFHILQGQLSDACEQEGLEKVNTGGSFDPRYHESVGFVETQEKADDHIFDVLSSGYKLGERLVRPAMVRVARNPYGVVNAPEVAPQESPETPKAEAEAPASESEASEPTTEQSSPEARQE